MICSCWFFSSFVDKKQQRITRPNMDGTRTKRPLSSSVMILVAYCCIILVGAKVIDEEIIEKESRDHVRRERLLLRRGHTARRIVTVDSTKSGSDVITDIVPAGNLFQRQSISLHMPPGISRQKGFDEKKEISKSTETQSNQKMAQPPSPVGRFSGKQVLGLRPKPAFSEGSGTHDYAVLGHEASSLRNHITQVRTRTGTPSARVMIQYSGREGKALVMSLAKTVHHDFREDETISVTLDYSAIDQLRRSSHIRNVEQDSIWSEQGYLAREIDDISFDYDLHLYNNRNNTGTSNLRHRQLERSDVPYGIRMIQADQVQVGPHPVSVCIIDTGLAIHHPDIDVDLASGVNRVSNVDRSILQWDNDIRGHGTHVAGTISAKKNDYIGIQGIGEINVFITRGLDDRGSAFESDIREAMEQCEASNARIVNLSLGGDKMSKAMKNICERMYRNGFLLFAAAGNAGEWKMEYPASDPTVISVSAVDKTEWYWSMSNYGPTLELMAPGFEILSTSVNATGHPIYAEYTGTSMATPFASGAAAILWSHYPKCTNKQIRYALAYTAKDMGVPGCDTDFGYGILQVKNALDFLETHPCEDANWGQDSGSGNCTAVDVEPFSGQSDTEKETPYPSLFDLETEIPVENTEEEEFSEWPSLDPTKTDEPTDSPTTSPIVVTTPTHSSSSVPTQTEEPTMEPSRSPVHRPTSTPTYTPTDAPTRRSSHMPSKYYSSAPSQQPTREPSLAPSEAPSIAPSPRRTEEPTSPTPTFEPTTAIEDPPTETPTLQTLPETVTTPNASQPPVGKDDSNRKSYADFSSPFHKAPISRKDDRPLPLIAGRQWFRPISRPRAQRDNTGR